MKKLFVIGALSLLFAFAGLAQAQTAAQAGPTAPDSITSGAAAGGVIGNYKGAFESFGRVGGSFGANLLGAKEDADGVTGTLRLDTPMCLGEKIPAKGVRTTDRTIEITATSKYPECSFVLKLNESGNTLEGKIEWRGSLRSIRMDKY